ncbi:MAG: AMP-binding protein [Phycisphaerales bacterium]|nr:AMP-binding protein [Phycisphaerales bacterium]
MRILKPIMRHWRHAPLKVFCEDDHRQWRGATMWVAARHLAKWVASTTDAQNVGIFLPTSGAFPIAMAASWLCGRTIVPLNYLLARDELDYIIDHAELDTVITASPMLDRFGDMPEGVNSLRIDKMNARGLPPMMRAVQRPDEDTAVVLYTSGTSGRPKGVMLSGTNLMTNVRQCVQWADFNRSDGFLGVLPQFHSFGLCVCTVLPFSIGCRAYYTAQFKVMRVLQILREKNPTAFMAIPSMYNALLQAKSAKDSDFESLRFIVSGGEPLPDAVYEGFAERFKVRICEGFGMTETSPVTNWTLPEEERRGTVGRAVDGVEQIIVGDGGEKLGPGQDGELRIRGGNVMKGYYKMPQETKAAFDEEGFLCTGDMARIDEDGFLSITGRIKEMLIIGGENVFPREIEEVLVRHPSVSEAAVIGVQDPSRGEVALAFVETIEGCEFDAGALRSWCRESLAGYKVPREIRWVESLPRNPVGKVMRRELTPETGLVKEEVESQATGESG